MTKKQTSAAEFKTLSQEEKLALLRQDGVYVGKVSRGKNINILFQLYHFYVEVRYNNYRRTVAGISVSEDLALLSPYIDQVIVRELDKNGSEE